MKSFPFKKINAFTQGLSGGNPCACVYLNCINDISEQEMQLIARELKGFVNEVVYLFPEEKYFSLRYYSAECEVDFCGHGTIGIMYDLIKSRRDLVAQHIIKIRVQNEYLSIYNKIKDSDSIFITAPAPRYNRLDIKKENIARALNIKPEEISNTAEPELINAGLNTLIVPLEGLSICLEMIPDQIQLKTFCLNNGIDIILVFTGEVTDQNNKYRTRVFAPKYGYLEDPATGSGNSAFGNYLMKNGLWKGDGLSIEQNNSHDFPNIVKLDTVREDSAKKILFGGSAVVKIQGEYKLS